jgi:hypothetical protein
MEMPTEDTQTSTPFTETFLFTTTTEQMKALDCVTKKMRPLRRLHIARLALAIGLKYLSMRDSIPVSQRAIAEAAQELTKTTDLSNLFKQK